LIIDAKDFHFIIESIVLQKSCTYMEAVQLYQAEANVEMETVASFVKQSSVLKVKIQEEAEVLKLVRPSPNKLKFA